MQWNYKRRVDMSIKLKYNHSYYSKVHRLKVTCLRFNTKYKSSWQTYLLAMTFYSSKSQSVAGNRNIRRNDLCNNKC